MFLVMFLGVAKLGKICLGLKICVREANAFFVFRAAKFVSGARFLRG